MAEKAANVLYDAYNAMLDGTPDDTIRMSIEAQGLDKTRYAVCQLINRSSWDGRLSRRNVEYAGQFETYPDYVPSGTIHMAHLNQLADALRKVDAA